MQEKIASATCCIPVSWFNHNCLIFFALNKNFFNIYVDYEFDSVNLRQCKLFVISNISIFNLTTMKDLSLLVLNLFFLLSPSYSSESKDNFWGEINIFKSNSSKLEELEELVKECIKQGKSQQAFQYATQGLQLSLKIGTHKTISASATLTEPPALNLELTYNNTTKPNCNKNCTGYASIDESKIGGAGPYTYNWFEKIGNRYVKINNEFNNTISQLCVGQFKVKVTDHNSCSEEKYFSIKCENKHTNKFELEDKSSLKLHPNPTKDILTVEIHLIDEAQGEVYLLNILGHRVLKVKQGSLFNEKIDMNVSNLKAGIYYVQVITQDEILLEKLVIVR
jgi:hypothetical protein